MLRIIVAVAAAAQPVSGEMLCGSGAPRALARLEGATGLVELTLSLWLKTKTGCAPMKHPYVASAVAQWHEGCTLISGVFRETPRTLTESVH